MKFSPFLILILLLNITCQPSDSKSSASEAIEFSYPKYDSTATSEELKTTSLALIKHINNQCLQARKQDKTVSLFGQQETPVSLWYSKQGELLKIDCGVANESGLIQDKFSYYFIQDKLWYANQIYAQYILDDGQLQFWLDEHWKKNSISSRDKKSRAVSLQKQVEVLRAD